MCEHFSTSLKMTTNIYTYIFFYFKPKNGDGLLMFFAAACGFFSSSTDGKEDSGELDFSTLLKKR